MEDELKEDERVELEIHGKTHFTVALYSIYLDVKKGKLKLKEDIFYQNYVSLKFNLSLFLTLFYFLNLIYISKFF
jgi:hypothetical protein